MEDKKEAGGADAWRTTLGTTKSVPTGNAGGFNKGGSSAAAATKPAEKSLKVEMLVVGEQAPLRLVEASDHQYERK